METGVMSELQGPERHDSLDLDWPLRPPPPPPPPRQPLQPRREWPQSLRSHRSQRSTRSAPDDSQLPPPPYRFIDDSNDPVPTPQVYRTYESSTETSTSEGISGLFARRRHGFKPPGHRSFSGLQLEMTARPIYRSHKIVRATIFVTLLVAVVAASLTAAFLPGEWRQTIGSVLMLLTHFATVAELVLVRLPVSKLAIASYVLSFGCTCLGAVLTFLRLVNPRMAAVELVLIISIH
ncbi:hypothetical protein IWZ00DRAFT_490093 [Phyllosticta capitalensis]|uniref:Transmembrane protein n=1 Tax=Phyllosticta capitalensis TaxID=121624 RepID=A0ABR1YJG2_9PEZI